MRITRLKITTQQNTDVKTQIIFLPLNLIIGEVYCNINTNNTKWIVLNAILTCCVCCRTRLRVSRPLNLL